MPEFHILFFITSNIGEKKIVISAAIQALCTTRPPYSFKRNAPFLAYL